MTDRIKEAARELLSIFPLSHGENKVCEILTRLVSETEERVRGEVEAQFLAYFKRFAPFQDEDTTDGVAINTDLIPAHAAIVAAVEEIKEK